MKKQIILFLALAFITGLQAMESDECFPEPMDSEYVPELRRVGARPEDIALLNLLRGRYYAGASEMINGGVGHSALAEVELKKENVARGVVRAAMLARHSNTINALVALGAFPPAEVQSYFTYELRHMEEHKDSQERLIMLLNTNARKLIDLNQQLREHQLPWTVTPLCHAAMNSLPNIVEALLIAGADVNKQKSDWQTPLMCVLKTYPSDSQTEIFQMFLAQPDINLSLRDENGYTALIWAAVANAPVALIEQLLAKGADINAKDNHGTTVLMHALGATNGVVSAANAMFLIESGADVNAKDRSHYTALDYAQKSHNAEIRALVPLIKANMKRIKTDE